MNIEQEKEYQIMPTTDGNLVFTIEARANEVSNPKVLYDGGKHALLYRTDEDVVILDYLNPAAIAKLQKLSSTFVSEINAEKEEVARLYKVHIHQVFKYPIDISTYV